MGLEFLPYRRRHPEKTLLYKVVSKNCENFFQAQSYQGIEYPKHVTSTFFGFLKCGIPEYGFIRSYCKNCRHTEITAFSCKQRGFCNSCHGKRMVESEVHLESRVFPNVQVRQWVLSLPYETRFAVANKPELIPLFKNIFIKAVNRWIRRKIKDMGIDNPVPASVCFIQRFGGALQVNPHFHALFFDGAFYEKNGNWFPHAVQSPSTEDLEHILSRIVRVAQKKFKDYDFFKAYSDGVADAMKSAVQPVVGYKEENSLLIQVPKGVFVENMDPYSVKQNGFSLNAQVVIERHQRDKLKKLIRYTARGPIAMDRLEQIEDKIVYKMKKPWHNGADRVCFSELDFFKRLVALIPPARSHLIRFDGAFAPNFKYRDQIVPKLSEDKSEQRQSKKLLWAEAIANSFKADVTLCPKCQGRLEPIAVIKDYKVALQILAAIGEITTIEKNNRSTGPPDIYVEYTSKAQSNVDQRPTDW